MHEKIHLRIQNYLGLIYQVLSAIFNTAVKYGSPKLTLIKNIWLFNHTEYVIYGNIHVSNYSNSVTYQYYFKTFDKIIIRE